MFGKILFLAALALVQGRPEFIKSAKEYPNLWEPSDLCPPIHNHHLLPHESDCSKFYYCEYGMKRIDATDCAIGTLFSYKEQVCVHPWDADCGNQPGPEPTASPVNPSSSSPNPPTDQSTYPNLWEPSDLCPPIHEHHLLPHEGNCSKFYYCEYGKKRIDATDCAPGTVFSFKEQVCVHSWQCEDCQHCGLPGPTNPPGLGPVTNPPTDQSTYPNLWEPSDLCPPIHEHHLLPHEGNCSKFYYCEYGMKRIDATDCAPGTVFSFKEQVCVHSWQCEDCQHCGLPGPTNPPGLGPVTNPPTDQSTYPNLWEPSDLCPPIHEHHLLPYEGDCSKFYYCEYGMKRINATDCAPRTVFSFKEQVCVHSWQCEDCQHCGLPGPTNPPGLGPVTNPPTDQSTYPNLWEPSDLCPPTHEHHLLPHEGNCSKLYYCEYGMKRIDATDCAPGTVFSFKEQVCVHPWQCEDCQHCGLPGPTNPPGLGPVTNPPTDQSTYPNLWEPSDLCPPIHEHHLLPHEGNCSKFYYCEYGMKRIDATDCAPGTVFSFKEQVCVHSWQCEDCQHCGLPGPTNPPGLGPVTNPPTDQSTYPNLWEPSDLCPPIHEHHLLPYEGDCSKFYYCEYGMKRINATDCAPGTVFSFKEQVCVHSWQCEDCQHCGLPGPTNPPGLGPVTNPPTDQSTYPNLWEPSDLCPPTHEHHLLPHEGNCSKFYYCEYGMKRIDATDCAPGTVFSFKEQVCVHPWQCEDCQHCGLPGPTNPPGLGPVTNPPTDQSTYPNLWEPSDLCPPIHEHHLLPHEYDCTKFYYCEYGLKRIDPTDCALGTVFSFKEQVCVHPWQCEDCENCGLPGPGPTDAPPLPCLNCPPVTDPPVTPSEATTAPSPPPTPPPTAPPTAQPTPSPTAPPVTPTEATTAEATTAPSSPTTPPPTAPPTAEPTPSPTAPPVTPTEATTAEATTAPSSTTTPPPTAPPTAQPTPSPTAPPIEPPTTPCNCEDGGTDCEVDYDAICRDGCHVLPWAHATDCDKFWRCEGDKAVRVICAEGLHFNPSTATCDFMCNAGCVRRHTTTTTYADGLKVFVPFSEIGRNDAVNTIQTRIQKAVEYAKRG